MMPEKRKRKRRPYKPKMPSLTAEEILMVYRMKDEGKSGKSIAHTIGKAESTVWRTINKRDIYEPLILKELGMNT